MKLPWWENGETMEVVQERIENAKKRFYAIPGAPQAMETFVQRSRVMCVLLANETEEALSTNLDQVTTYRLLAPYVEAEEEGASDVAQDEQATGGQPVVPWPAEGGSGGSGRAKAAQLVQFAKALMYLSKQAASKTPLKSQTICTAHRLALRGAYEEDGTRVSAGTYRTTPACSGTGYVHPDASAIPSRVDQIVVSYNKAVAEGAAPHSLAAKLLYQTLKLHPFQNGNGRLARLLAVYAMLSAGVPFPLHLSNGHTKFRKHYQHALRHAGKHDTLEHIEAFVLECLSMQWQNAVRNAEFYN